MRQGFGQGQQFLAGFQLRAQRQMRADVLADMEQAPLHFRFRPVFPQSALETFMPVHHGHVRRWDLLQER